MEENKIIKPYQIATNGFYKTESSFENYKWTKDDLIRFFPHRYSYKYYPWQRKYFESDDEMIIILGGNQMGKSTIAISKTAELGTNKHRWKKAWPETHNTVNKTFYYFYPTKKVIRREFDIKWKPLLCHEDVRDNPITGWDYKNDDDGKTVEYLGFKTNVRVYYIPYTAERATVEGTTVHYICCDEEMPFGLFSTLRSRRRATKGLINFVFTIGEKPQEEWRRVLKPRFKEEELLADVKYKKRVTAWECMFYEDGTPSKWTPEYIKKEEALCVSEAEKLNKLYGDYVIYEGVVFKHFSRDKNVIDPVKIPDDWIRYAGIDYGAGGTAHPSAICLFAVKPDFSECYLYDAWKGDGEETTPTDVIDKFEEMADGHTFAHITYDSAAKPLKTVGARRGLSMRPSVKDTEGRFQTLDNLFALNMCKIFDYKTFEPRWVGTHKAAVEFSSITEDMLGLSARNKRKKNDDLSDAATYCVFTIPFNFELGRRKFIKDGNKASINTDEIKKVAKKKVERYGIAEGIITNRCGPQPEGLFGHSDNFSEFKNQLDDTLY